MGAEIAAAWANLAHPASLRVLIARLRKAAADRCGASAYWGRNLLEKSRLSSAREAGGKAPKQIGYQFAVLYEGVGMMYVDR